MQYPNYGLGRIPVSDTKDQLHLMSALPTVAVTRTVMHWPGAVILDQGPYPFCVGYAWKGFKRIAPTITNTGLSATQIYTRAQELDEWPGSSYNGTSVRAGAKVLQEEGVLEEYLWAQTITDITNWLLTRGPVVMGTDWRRGMFTPDNTGRIHTGGESVGGHAYLLSGYNSHTKLVRIINSWGRGWGQAGRAWIHEDDLQMLLANGGEACTAVERKIA